MTTTPRTRVGFVSPSASWGPHYDHFLALAPDGVPVQIEPLALYGGLLEERRGAADTHLARTATLVRKHGWEGWR